MRTRRNTELALVLAAVLIAVLGYIEVGVNIDGSVPSGAAGYGAALGVLALLAHGVIHAAGAVRGPAAAADRDPAQRGRAGRHLPAGPGHPRSEAAPTQLLWSTLGVALFIAVVLLLRDHKRLQRYAYSGALVALVLLVLPVLFPPVYGSRIWITVGPLSFQPGEFAKILLAVFFAAYLAVHRDALALTGRRFWGCNCRSAGCSGRCC